LFSQPTAKVKATFENDPILGWAFSWVIKTYSEWSDSREAAQQQQLQMQQQLKEAGRPWQKQTREQTEQQQAQEQRAQEQRQSQQQQQQQQQPSAEDRKPWWRKPREQKQQ
jgi:hypothetical protein